MCRSKDHGGRRCPLDSNDARRRRYQNAKMRANAGEQTLSPAVSLSEVQTDLPDPGLSVDERRTRVKEILDAGTFDTERIQEIGGHIEAIAHDAYGAPTDTDITIGIMERENADLERVAALEGEENAVRAQLIGFAERNGLEVEDMENRSLISAHFEVRNAIGKMPEDQRAKLALEEREIFDKSPGRSQKEFEMSNARTEALDAVYASRAEAYRKALESTGVTFYDPDVHSLSVHEKSKKSDMDTLKKALHFVPASWVQHSNEAADRNGLKLLVRSSPKRAHYQPGRLRRVGKKKINVVSSEFRNSSFDPRADPTSRDYYNFVEPMPKDGYKQGNGYTFSGYKYDPRHNDENVTEWVVQHQEWRQCDEQPRGRGWKKAAIKDWNGDGTHTEWYRPRTEMTGGQYETISEVTINGKGRYAESIALHEFTHRADHSMPDMYPAEMKFLQSRIGEDEKIVPVTPGTREMGYADKFHEIYAGRIYGRQGSSEIMSMGMEQVFYGRHGAFVGDKADDGYKHFVLGTLAMTSRGGRS